MKTKLSRVAEVCEALRIDRQTLRRYRLAGCPHVRCGRQTYRYNIPSILAWAQGQTAPPALAEVVAGRLATGRT